MLHFRTALIVIATVCLLSTASAADQSELKVAVFQTDVTPPIGSPVAYAPTRSIVDPLSARGIVLTGAGKPIVLCAIDWIGIGNGGHDTWRQTLAKAAGTTADRVAVHALHQHDAPICDFSATKLLAAQGIEGYRYDDTFTRVAMRNVAKAVHECLAESQSISHIGVGVGIVEKVASNRRILGPDGKVAIVRFSSCRNPEAIAAPEGVIDPHLRLLSFWNGKTPIVVLTYYACHPQSYYGKGDVSCDFVGLARNARQKATGIPHIHFDGAGGNVAAGKYNDGSPEMRPILTKRLAEGMKEAWEAVKREPITAKDVSWTVERVLLPPSAHLDAEKLKATLQDDDAKLADRGSAARKLAFLARVKSGNKTELCCLGLNDHRILHYPGELFVEYQLAAAKMWAAGEVFVAAYGDYGPGYIGTARAYPAGGYETSPRASSVAPSVEEILLDGTRQLLGLEKSDDN